MAVSSGNLIWLDLEMTGLDVASEHIIEIATLLTDAELETVAEGPTRAIQAPDAVLEQMDEWNTRQHNASGLVQRVRASHCGVAQAEQDTLEFLRGYVPPASSPMCGSGICQDRRFLARWMPELERYFHYRNLDVSTVKELARRWAPGQKEPKKQSKHLAMDDIRDSIAELRYYRQWFFRCEPGK